VSEITLKEYLESKIENLKNLVYQRFEQLALALNKESESTRIHFENLNEWREQNRDERNLYATKETMDLILTAIDSRLKRLETANAFSAGKMWMVMAGFALIPTIIAVVAILIR